MTERRRPRCGGGARTGAGSGALRYLTTWRLSLASGLLLTTTLSVGEIAASVGYGSEEAFSRAFKRELGAAPAHWRAR